MPTKIRKVPRWKVKQSSHNAARDTNVCDLKSSKTTLLEERKVFTLPISESENKSGWMSYYLKRGCDN